LELGLAQQTLGETAAASASLRNAATLTRNALGARHPEALATAAAWARARAQGGDAGALRELEAMARSTGTSPEAALARVRAGAYLTEASCQRPPAARTTTVLAALRAPLAQWQPEGGALTREVAAIEAACPPGP
jgi:serine/threonine-protein kinase